jgi:hypothetical protein
VLLETNDPSRPEVRLSIAGRVARVCAAEPAAVLFPSLQPTETGRSRVLVYSRLWKTFEITSVQTALPGVSWEIQSASPEELAEHDARSGQWVTVLVEPEVPAGEFGGLLTLNIQPQDGQSPPIELPIDVSGRKLGRIAIIGPEIADTGTVQLGPIGLGQEKTCRLLLRYRGDSEQEIPLRIESDTPYVTATITSSQRNTRNLFDLEIRVAQDAPLCNHMHPRPAQLHLISDHPQDPQVTLSVEFAVIRP